MAWTTKLLIACFFAFLASTVFLKISDSDVWLHLTIGRAVVQDGRIPSVNAFSFTEPEHAWMPHEWLSGALFYGLFSQFGAGGLILLRLFVFAGIFGLLLRLVHAPRWEWVNVAGLMLIIGAVQSLITDRPQMFSALFFVSYFYILEKWRQGTKGWIWLIPPLQALWVNMHGYFLFGLALLSLFWLGEFFLRERRLLASRESRQLGLVGVAALAACLINPHFHQGITGVLYAAVGASGTPIHEWQPPYSSFEEFAQASWAYADKRLILIPFLLFLANFRKPRITYWLVWAVFLMFYMKSRRNILFFTLAAVPIALCNLRWVVETYFKTKRFKIRPAFELGLSALLIWGACDMATGRYFAYRGMLTEWGIGVSKVLPPAQACDFIEQAGLVGPAFNNYGIGNYLMWRFPERKVFIDGRNNEAYSPEFLAYYSDLMRGRVSISELTRRYPIHFFLIGHTYPDSDTARLIQALERDSRWSLAYVDHTSVIYIPGKKGATPVVRGADGLPVTGRERWETVWRHERLGSILDLLGRQEEAVAEYQKALAIEPGFPPAQQGLETSLARKKG